MDRLKFRVWDKQLNQYRTPGDIQLGANGKTFIISKELPNLYQDIEDVIVEFCTGLKDKNGNLIYEGDIVSNGAYEGVVKYGKFNCNCCDGVYGWYFDDCADIRYVEHYEVVGNIHEQKDNK